MWLEKEHVYDAHLYKDTFTQTKNMTCKADVGWRLGTFRGDHLVWQWRYSLFSLMHLYLRPFLPAVCLFILLKGSITSSSCPISNPSLSIHSHQKVPSMVGADCDAIGLRKSDVLPSAALNCFSAIPHIKFHTHSMSKSVLSLSTMFHRYYGRYVVANGPINVQR